MPLYDFRCNECGDTRDVLANYEIAERLELICVRCGGGMTLKPVLAVNILRSRASHVDRASNSRGGPVAPQQGRACGHAYRCRCSGVRLTKPNPFRAEIRKAAGIVDEA